MAGHWQMNVQLNPPAPFMSAHCVDDFDSGEAVLGEWLKRRAMANQSSGASRTFVVAVPDGVVYGYYAMAAGAVAHQLATTKVRRNMPDPVPVPVLARLAVDRRAQGIKLGASMLQDAVKRAAMVSKNAGVRALLVHALHDRAKAPSSAASNSTDTTWPLPGAKSPLASSAAGPSLYSSRMQWRLRGDHDNDQTLDFPNCNNPPIAHNS